MQRALGYCELFTQFQCRIKLVSPKTLCQPHHPEIFHRSTSAGLRTEKWTSARAPCNAKEPVFRVPHTWTGTAVLPGAGCVALVQSPHLSEPQFSPM